MHQLCRALIFRSQIIPRHQQGIRLQLHNGFERSKAAIPETKLGGHIHEARLCQHIGGQRLRPAHPAAPGNRQDTQPPGQGGRPQPGQSGIDFSHALPGLVRIADNLAHFQDLRLGLGNAAHGIEFLEPEAARPDEFPRGAPGEAPAHHKIRLQHQYLFGAAGNPCEGPRLRRHP